MEGVETDLLEMRIPHLVQWHLEEVEVEEALVVTEDMVDLEDILVLSIQTEIMLDLVVAVDMGVMEEVVDLQLEVEEVVED